MSDRSPSPGLWADLILDISRSLRTSLPAPKGAPFLGMDLEMAGDPGLLEALSGPGIFRKYEQVLLFGGGLGGSARWLSLRLGCKVVALAPDAEWAAAGARLQAASRHDGHVDFVAARPNQVPVCSRGVTHAWMLGLPESPEAMLHEAFRALRPGGQLALQWMDAAAPDAATTTAALLALLGFEAIEVHHSTPREAPQSFRLARQRLRSELERRGETMGADSVGLPATLLQLHARRPA